MATTARQQYFADESSLSKEKREFSIADGIQEKIDSVEEWAQVNKIEAIRVNWTTLAPDTYKAVDIDVPEVIDNLYTVDSDNALSAKQWKLLYDYIQNIASRWRFLSNWNSVTGLPMTNPSESPYPYKSWDYFVVSNVAWLWGTNYRPDGSLYVIWQASTVVETDEVDVSDFYFYDGTNWLLLKNSGRSLAVDSSLSTTSTNPVENRVITNAINWKQNTLIAWNNIQIAADWKTISATDTTYSAWANISINANNEISAVDTKYTAWTNVQISAQNVISATDTKYTAWTWINIDANNEISNTLPWAIVSATAPSNPTEWMVWYDTANDSLKAYNWTSWETEWTKMVVLEYWVSTWQDFLDAYNKNALVYCRVSSWSSGYRMAFMAYTAWQWTPTEVEFQYYRSRSSHSQDSTQLDEVYVYKLTNAWTWTTTQRDTWARITNGTWISISSVTSSWITTRTISADTTVLATKTDLNSKQDTLVSWTNIKTVNSNSLLGSWNITLNDVKSSATAPSNPAEWMLWYDTTNDQLKVYDWSQWNVVWDDTANINTKTFYLTPWSSATAIQKWQECYDWYKAWNNPIVSYNWVNYHLSKVDSTWMLFKSENDSMSSTNASVSTLQKTGMVVQLNWDTVIWVSSTVLNVGKVLATDVNYSTVYTPQYDWSPATKKYVDDAIAWVWWWIEVDSASPIQLTKIWAWSQSDYDNLGSYDATTVYLTI